MYSTWIRLLLGYYFAILDKVLTSLSMVMSQDDVDMVVECHPSPRSDI